MRVPSVGLPLDERRIVREGYRLAERMLADYRDPPGMVEVIGARLLAARAVLVDFYRVLVRN